MEFQKLIHIRDCVISLSDSITSAKLQMHKWVSEDCFLPKMAYEFFRPKSSKVPWYKVVWDPIITPKHVFCLWLAAKGKLQTKDRMPFVQLQSCPLCNSVQETASHLLFVCPAVKLIWNDISAWIGFPTTFTSTARILSWAMKALRGKSLRVRASKICIAAIFYNVWRTRNNILFDGHLFVARDVSHKVMTHVYRVMHKSFPHLLADF